MLDNNNKILTEEAKKLRAEYLRQEIIRVSARIKQSEIFQTLKTIKEWNMFIDGLRKREIVLKQDKERLNAIDFNNYENNKARLLKRANIEGKLSELSFLINTEQDEGEDNRRHIEKKAKIEAELKALEK